MKRLFLIAALLCGASIGFPATASRAGDFSSPHCLEVCPRERLPDLNRSDDLITIVREAYSMVADPHSKLARWVAYRLSEETLASNRTRHWAADPKLVEPATLEPEDYKGAHATLGMDRGHFAPLASLAGVRDWASLNYLSNIAPQRSTLNAGAWARLENAERQLATSGEAAEVYVLTGPLYEHEMPPLPGADEPHLVPSGFWKIVAIQTSEGVERAAFIFDQDSPRNLPYCKGLVTVGDIERRAGLAFAPSGGGIRPLAESHQSLAKRLGCAP
ncbi:DNA/RNA non-specific endonuclease [Govanella unica]|uniref:DNA/RNA non-specific endonuclease n=1 Tax=Govanella unica TaxID=2975056 RepID=A0A9X3TWK6_9PROT|nr:DNA/RNA non-specific endonuclease [Govania unica]MDA5193032.1 DNA/RNA non-specific endonuclease [Govania unica]